MSCQSTKERSPRFIILFLTRIVPSSVPSCFQVSDHLSPLSSLPMALSCYVCSHYCIAASLLLSSCTYFHHLTFLIPHDPVLHQNDNSTGTFLCPYISFV